MSHSKCATAGFTPILPNEYHARRLVLAPSATLAAVAFASRAAPASAALDLADAASYRPGRNSDGNEKSGFLQYISLPSLSALPAAARTLARRLFLPAPEPRAVAVAAAVDAGARVPALGGHASRGHVSSGGVDLTAAITAAEERRARKVKRRQNADIERGRRALQFAHDPAGAIAGQGSFGARGHFAINKNKDNSKSDKSKSESTRKPKAETRGGSRVRATRLTSVPPSATTTTPTASTASTNKPKDKLTSAATSPATSSGSNKVRMAATDSANLKPAPMHSTNQK